MEDGLNIELKHGSDVGSDELGQRQQVATARNHALEVAPPQWSQGHAERVFPPTRPASQRSFRSPRRYGNYSLSPMIPFDFVPRAAIASTRPKMDGFEPALESGGLTWLRAIRRGAAFRGDARIVQPCLIRYPLLLPEGQVSQADETHQAFVQ